MTHDESYIQYSAGGTLLVGPDAVRLACAATLSSALGLLKKGITPTRGLTVTRALAMVKQYSGKTYKRTEIDQARADLGVWITTMKAALPVKEG